MSIRQSPSMLIGPHQYRMGPTLYKPLKLGFHLADNFLCRQLLPPPWTMQRVGGCLASSACSSIWICHLHRSSSSPNSAWCGCSWTTTPALCWSTSRMRLACLCVELSAASTTYVHCDVTVEANAVLAVAAFGTLDEICPTHHHRDLAT
jgi:hypothetical protein